MSLKALPIKIDWNPDLSIYASESFLKSVSDEYGWLGGIDGQGNIRCILPYTIIKKAFFRLVRFRVETIPMRADLEIQEEKNFLNSAIEFFRGIGADMIIPATTNTIFRTYPDGADAAPYGTYIIDLQQPEKTIWGNISSSHRRKIRHARKNGVEIKNGLEYLEIVHQLVRDTFKRSSIPFMGLNEFSRMITGLSENVKIFIAEHGRSVQGCLVVPFSNHSAYYVYGGSILQPEVGATNLLHWEAIRYFKERNVKRYDFVGVRINPKKGSKQEGLMLYKQRFGGELVQGYIWKYSINPIKYPVYSMAVRLLRGGDIVDRERFKLGRFC